jgi:hypothetical protein
MSQPSATAGIHQLSFSLFLNYNLIFLQNKCLQLRQFSICVRAWQHKKLSAEPSEAEHYASVRAWQHKRLSAEPSEAETVAEDYASVLSDILDK